MLLRLWLLVLLLVLGVLAPGVVDARIQDRVWPPAASAEKLASWGGHPETAVLRQAATMQAAETQQAASSLGYETASVLSLAPERIPTNTLKFQGLEVRAVRDLSHVDDATLRAMADKGFAARTVNGDKIVLHHHQQNPAGFIVEVPAPNHSIGNVRQHPFGNTAGAGLSAEQRAAFDTWRGDYWKMRANEELARRAAGGTP